MRRILLFVCIGAACSGCDGRDGRETPPQAYQRWEDKIVAATHIPFFGLGGLCGTGWVNTKYGGYYDRLPPEQCYEMDPPRHWKGLWRNEFEGSRFCPAPATECSYGTPGDKIWFNYWFGVTNTHPIKWKVQPGGLYAVDFIGRRTKYKGSYGQFGMSDHWMSMDRLISIREVEAPPRRQE